MSTAAYKLRLDKALDREFERIIRSQVTRARRSLKSADDEGVHTARKALKRARAALRLIRGAVPKERFRELDSNLKAIGKQLAGVRDAAVAVMLTELLAVDGAIKSTIAGNLLEYLGEFRDAAWNSLLADNGVEAIRDQLHGLRLNREELGGLNALALHDGLSWTYARGTERLASAVELPTAESFHSWRKQTKHYGYQIRLLTPAWPLVLRSEARAIDKLTEALGDDHDFSELGRLARQAELSKDALRAVQKVVRKRRKALEPTIWPLGARIYAEDPGSVAGRMTVYLAAALAEERGAPIHPLDGMALPAPPNRPLIAVS